jgi:hypothetical protein
MPTYKNRPPMDPDTPVWRYFSLNAAIATVRDRRLRFTRLDRFDDPFEGSVPKRQMDDQVALFAGAHHMRMVHTIIASHYPSVPPPKWDSEDPWTRMTRLRRAMTQSTHACCWAAGDESEPLWRLYCTDDGPRGVGIALRTTLAKLEASIEPHDLYVSPVTYRQYHEGPAFDDELDSFMHKRNGFSAEKEVRLLKLNRGHYHTLIAEPRTAAELDKHLFLDWPAADAIENIVLSPYADESFEERARAAIQAVAASLQDRVILSDLNPRQYAPGF